MEADKRLESGALGVQKERKQGEKRNMQSPHKGEHGSNKQRAITRGYRMERRTIK